MADYRPEPGDAELRQLADAVQALRARLGHAHAVGDDPQEVRDSPFAHLVERIRAEVAERRHGAGASTPPPLDVPRLEPFQVAAPASLTPPPPIAIRGEYTLGELLSYEGEDFVANIYRAMLGRNPDPGGMAFHLDLLYAGTWTKTEMLDAFRDSEEGRQRGATVHGLARAARIQRWRRLPVVGPLIAIMHLILRLPMMARDLEHHELLLFRRKRELRATIAAVDAISSRGAAAMNAFGEVLQALNHAKAPREGMTELGGRVAALRYEIARLDAELERRARGGEVLRIGQAMVATANGLRSAVIAIGERTEQLPRLRERIDESARRIETLGGALEALASGKADAAEVLPRLDSAEAALARKAEAAEVVPRLEAAEAALGGKAEAARVEPRLDAVEEALRRKAESAEVVPRLAAAEAALSSKAEAARVEPRLDAVEEALWRKAETAELLPRFEAMQRGLDAKAEGIEVERRLGELATRDGLEAILAQGGSDMDQFYLDFEDHFRGSREDIRGRVAVYLPHVTELGAGTDHAPILDVGCGRGEWLELLAQSGLVARGLDLNARMVEVCRGLGLEVEQAEAIAYLERLEEGTLGAITAMHVIEHLPFRQRVRFLDAALRALRPGGLAILETPNPENITVGSCSFWTDPTHLAPLPPESMRAIAELRGFSRIEIVRLHPLPAEMHLPATRTPVRDTLNHLLFGPQDYAILAYKAALEDDQ